MKKDRVKEIKKEERKVFTERKDNSTINTSYNPLEANHKICKRRDGLYMNNIKLKETMFIDEESYQQVKQNICKNDDYFTEEELQKFSVILA